jgi:hypothetical protein
MAIHADIMAIQRQNHEHGSLLVAPDFHHKLKLPAPAQESRAFFETAMAKKPLLNKRVPVGRVVPGNEDAGVTYKRFVRMGGGVGKGGRIQPSKTYMLKPYYEDWGENDYGLYPYPTAGWTEMAAQALMHAGGLGHMSQTVHVHLPKAGPNRGVFGTGTPVLAVEIARGMHRVGNFSDVDRVTDPIRKDAATLCAFDFLIGNHDRHGNNLLVSVPAPDQPFESLLAIDHGRSFHYKKALGGGAKDNLLEYLGDSDGYSLFQLGEDRYRHDVMHAIAGWWQKHGSKMRIEMKKHLKGIKVAGMADNIGSQFGFRADALDKMVKTLKKKGAKAYFGDKPQKKAEAELAIPVDIHTPNQKPWRDNRGEPAPRKVLTSATDGFHFKTKRDTQGNTVFEDQGHS